MSITIANLPAEYFQRQDPRDDELFYYQPRKVVHIDEQALQTVERLLAQHLPPYGSYLDLMSSWRSHLPANLKPRRVAGLGMNADEMADNPQLTDYRTQNLNKNPLLPYADGEFDGAFCTVSVQYLTQPLRVFQEVHRVLKPNAPFVVTFSNRCFPTKAIALWLALNDEEHVALVSAYFVESAPWRNITPYRSFGAGQAHRCGDPLYAVWAVK
jgi:SAM-dependent methyltransferase